MSNMSKKKKWLKKIIHLELGSFLDPAIFAKVLAGVQRQGYIPRINKNAITFHGSIMCNEPGNSEDYLRPVSRGFQGTHDTKQVIKSSIQTRWNMEEECFRSSSGEEMEADHIFLTSLRSDTTIWFWSPSFPEAWFTTRPCPICHWRVDWVSELAIQFLAGTRILTLWIDSLNPGP